MNLTQSPVIPNLIIGGRVFTDLTNLLILYGHVGFAGSNGNCTVRKPAASAGYTPSGSKTFRVLAVRVGFQVIAASTDFKILYSDNDVGVGSNTAYTNGVYPGADSNLGGVIGQTASSTVQEYAYDFVVPNTKYLGVTNSAGNNVAKFMIFGYEV